MSKTKELFTIIAPLVAIGVLGIAVVSPACARGAAEMAAGQLAVIGLITSGFECWRASKATKLVTQGRC